MIIQTPLALLPRTHPWALMKYIGRASSQTVNLVPSVEIHHPKLVIMNDSMALVVAWFYYNDHKFLFNSCGISLVLALVLWNGVLY